MLTVFIIHKNEVIYIKKFEDEEEALDHATDLVPLIVKGVGIGITRGKVPLGSKKKTESFVV